MGGIQREGQGVRPRPPPLKNNKNIGFFTNTGLDPLKKSQSFQASIQSWLGHHRHASETPKMAFRWRADDDPLIVVLGFSLPSSTKKTVKVGPPLTKLSVSAHVFQGVNACSYHTHYIFQFNPHGFSAYKL